jgi:hypothetical protein
MWFFGKKNLSKDVLTLIIMSIKDTHMDFKHVTFNTEDIVFYH